MLSYFILPDLLKFYVFWIYLGSSIEDEREEPPRVQYDIYWYLFLMGDRATTSIMNIYLFNDCHLKTTPQAQVFHCRFMLDIVLHGNSRFNVRNDNGQRLLYSETSRY